MSSTEGPRFLPMCSKCGSVGQTHAHNCPLPRVTIGPPPSILGWRCPNCGAGNAPTTQTCPLCGPEMKVTC